MKQGIIEWFKKERKTIITAAVIGSVVTLVFAVFSGASYSENIVSGIADDIIRFHVIANSDSRDDQILKISVRDGLLKYIEPKLTGVTSAREAEVIISSDLYGLCAAAEEIIRSEGYPYDVKAVVENTDFPTKSYGDASFPAGNYRALRVIIGEGNGKNWWCVVFPPLCLVEETKTVVADSGFNQSLKESLSDEEYDIIVNSGEQGKMPVKIKFKAVEIYQEIKQMLND